MQSSRDTVHITPTEWRWVIILGSALVILAFIPFLWVGLSRAGSDQWQFMGVLNNPLDGATYLSKMLQGYNGDWLIHLYHTSEDHSGMLLQVLYPILGQISRFFSIPPVAIFHAARVVASLIMYMALYHFAASIWPRQRSRRIFFIIASIGSGLGWLLILFTGTSTGMPDLVIPEIFPFYSSLVNVHFPLAIACLALMSSVLIVTFRPGCTDNPTIANGGLLVSAISFILSLLYPQALVPFGVATTFLIAYRSVRYRHFLMRDIRWLLWLIVPALPLAVYYMALVNYNPAAAEWNRQNITPSPSPIVFVVGMGVPLLMALPGIARSLRRFEPDADQFVIVWLIAILATMYFPANTQRRFAVGLMIPIAFFATRAIEGYWFNYVNRRWRYRLMIAAIPTMTMSYVLILMGNMTIVSGPFLQRDYAAAFEFLNQEQAADQVVMAAPEVSAWVPSWVGARVVYGHPFETLYADVKQQQVADWYAGKNCDALIQQYNVRYVIVGPQEKDLGSAACVASLQAVFTYNLVTVYAP